MSPRRDLALEISRAFFELFMRRVSFFQAVAMEFGHSPFQARTLLRMDLERPTMMSEVAELAGCEPANLTGVVDKLEARGLVERKSSNDDRRVKMLSMTRQGRAQREQIIAKLMQPAPWIESLSMDDQRTLLALLRKGLAASSDPNAGCR